MGLGGRAGAGVVLAALMGVDSRVGAQIRARAGACEDWIFSPPFRPSDGYRLCILPFCCRRKAVRQSKIEGSGHAVFE